MELLIWITQQGSLHKLVFTVVEEWIEVGAVAELTTTKEMLVDGWVKCCVSTNETHKLYSHYGTRNRLTVIITDSCTQSIIIYNHHPSIQSYHANILPTQTIPVVRLLSQYTALLLCFVFRDREVLANEFKPFLNARVSPLHALHFFFSWIKALRIMITDSVLEKVYFGAIVVAVDIHCTSELRKKGWGRG